MATLHLSGPENLACRVGRVTVIAIIGEYPKTTPTFRTELKFFHTGQI
jgi:hypothetical protein